MFVILLTANFKFRNRSTCSKRPMKRAGKVCGDSQDLKSPGISNFINKTCNSFSAFNAVVQGVSWAHLKFGINPPSTFLIAK